MSAGGDGHVFWRLTLREVKNIMAGFEMQLDRRHNELMSLAWHISALHRSPKIPRLSELMRGAKAKASPKRPWQGDFAAVSAWVSATKR